MCSLALCAGGSAAALLVLRRDVDLLHSMVAERALRTSAVVEWQRFEVSLIVAEDHRYSHHFGLDPVAIARAIVQTYVFGRRQGASTIEQQLTRTLTGDYRQSFSRKVREALLASTLFRAFTKQELIEAYLSAAYFGHGICGLDAAVGEIQVPDEIANLSAPFVIAHLRYPRIKQESRQAHNRRVARARHIARRMGAALHHSGGRSSY
jgi:penicillin-binding protein 1A